MADARSNPAPNPVPTGCFNSSQAADEIPSDETLLTPQQASQRLGISRTTLYAWLGTSDLGEFVIRGVPFCIRYLQGGPRGQGRIRIAASEVQRLLAAMQVEPQRPVKRKRPVAKPTHYPGITVPLGRPDIA